MANKVFAVFVLCIVVLSAVHLHEAQAQDVYKACFTPCHKDCTSEGNGGTFCEVKCDNDCSAKVEYDQLNFKP